MVLLAAMRLKSHCSSSAWTSCLFRAVPAEILMQRKAQPEPAASTGSLCLENTFRVLVSLLSLQPDACWCAPTGTAARADPFTSPGTRDVPGTLRSRHCKYSYCSDWGFKNGGKQLEVTGTAAE